MQRTIEYTLSTQYTIIPAGDTFEEKAIQRTLDEIVANWHDQVVQGCEGATVTEVGEHLRVSTPGTVMSLSDTIFGGGTEAEGNIGMFHEGVGVAMILTTQLKKRGTDLNFRIHVVTWDNATTWTFDTGYSDTFKCEVLKVQETPGDPEVTDLPRGVHVMLDTRGYFKPEDYLFLREVDAGVWEYRDPTCEVDGSAHLEGTGTFLLNGGGVFFQGIRQRDLPGYRHGYNIKSQELRTLGRDRKLGRLDRAGLLQRVFAHAVDEGALPAAQVWALFDETPGLEWSEAPDLSVWTTYRATAGRALNTLWERAFPGEYPTDTDGSGRRLFEEAGVSDLLIQKVPCVLYRLLSDGRSAEDRVSERCSQVSAQYSWEELTDEERAALTQAVSRCNQALYQALVAKEKEGGESVLSIDREHRTLRSAENWVYMEYTYNDTRGHHGFAADNPTFSRALIDPGSPQFWEVLVRFMQQTTIIYLTKDILWSHLLVAHLGGE